jgi:hypothetical protein
MVLTIWTCFTVSIILSISEVYNLLGKDVPCIGGEGEDEMKKILCYKKFFNLTGKGFQAPMAIIALVISSKVKGFMSKLA